MQVLIDTGMLQIETSFFEEVARQSGQPLGACFQCQKCSSGCPVADYTDYTPAQVIRLLQYGLKGLLLKSRVIWLCSGCETCGARCPNGISAGRVMDALKEMVHPGNGKGIPELLFHRQFLKSVRAHGRVHEAGMMARYKLKSGQLFTDLKLGLALFKKGKLNFFPSRVKNMSQVRRIFNNAEKKSASRRRGHYFADDRTE